MNAEIIPYTDESAWLAHRAQDITSTESPSLFGFGRETAFELACRKDGKTDGAFKPNERTEIGKEIEHAIATRAARMYGVVIKHKKEYMRIPDLRMGSSFDYEIVGVSDGVIDDQVLRVAFGTMGPGLFEIKNVDSWIFKNEWISGDSGYEAPAHIEIQLQHQLEVCGYAWGCIVAFVGGNHIEIIVRLRDTAVGEALRRKICLLWQNLLDGIYPPVQLPEDLDVLKQIYGYAEPGRLLDARGRDDIHDALVDYIDAQRDEKGAKDRKDTAQGKLLRLIGDAEKVTTDIATISCGMVAPTVVPSYERKGYRNWRVTPKKVKP